MHPVQSSITIDAPPAAVWAVLSDITAMRAYLPRIASVERVSDIERGVGAARRCVFDDGVVLTERVTDWAEGAGYTLETTAIEGVPMRSNEITFTLAPHGDGTRVTQAMRYAMKGGIVAPLLERLVIGRMRSALDGALGGLKRHVEAG